MADVAADGGAAPAKWREWGGIRVAERPLAGAVIVALALAISLTAFYTIKGQLSLLELEINDRLRVLLPDHEDPQDPRISIAALTEETLIQFPYRSPVDRGFLAELMGVLAEAGAKGVVLDLLFDQQTELAKDEALIAAIREFPGPVVIAWGDENAGLIPEQHAYLKAFEEASGAILGFANVVTDRDGIVRNFATRLPGIEKSSMSAAMAEAATGEPVEMIEGVIDWSIPKPDGTTIFQTFPAHRLTQFGAMPAMQPRLKGWLADRIVFVGADLEQRDRHQTAMSADPTKERRIPGVLIQAHVLAQLLDGREAQIAPMPLAYAITAAMALLGAIIGLTRWGLLAEGIAALIAIGGYLAIVWITARLQIIYLPVAPALAAHFIALSLAIWLDGYLTQRDERFIRLAFSHYLEPAMVDQLAEDPESLRLGGDRREMSFIFTDIQGFTTMSEELPPDQLTRLLNDYFDGMSEIIIEHGGAIDKFIGDAVVAHFGAPTPMKDHALKALKCAERLDHFAEGFRKQNVHLGLGVTRIGVHSGIATVGNFGGRARFDYTAMGDAVNTAARLESSNKRYGTRIGVSQETAEMASAMAGPGERLPLLQTIGMVMLKGKTKPVTMYTINTDAEEEFVWAYEAAFSLIDLDLQRARTALEELFRSNPADPLVRWHLERLEKGGEGTLIGSA